MNLEISYATSDVKDMMEIFKQGEELEKQGANITLKIAIVKNPLDIFNLKEEK